MYTTSERKEWDGEPMYQNAAKHDEGNNGLDRRCEELCLICGWTGGFGEVFNRKSGYIYSP